MILWKKSTLNHTCVLAYILLVRFFYCCYFCHIVFLLIFLRDFACYSGDFFSTFSFGDDVMYNKRDFSNKYTFAL